MKHLKTFGNEFAKNACINEKRMRLFSSLRSRIEARTKGVLVTNPSEFYSGLRAFLCLMMESVRKMRVFSPVP